MSDDARSFQVDLADLEQIMARLEGFRGFLTESMSGLQSRIDTVQQNWTGESADAQAEAFRQWVAGATDVAEGIAAMKQAARAAHDRYSSAAAANLRMLGRG
ncbi:WXG100 family type VII secretion target [Nocardia mexicana]|uniref:ESAT-6-like protein n=1 Tax=Nocardia mexicana TaxID=279262 RepID=A0A370GSE4_9NOCA|nr:WXG100 family type VII secretion target [Nocardia mexicana]RDI46618.1 WXG100 family type VII secretion target [Nocardia mexicana]